LIGTGTTMDPLQREDLRSRAIALANHELRTPVTVIHSTLELLGDDLLGTLAPRQREMLASALACSRYLVEGVEEVTSLFADVCHAAHDPSPERHNALARGEVGLRRRAHARRQRPAPVTPGSMPRSWRRRAERIWRRGPRVRPSRGGRHQSLHGLDGVLPRPHLRGGYAPRLP
jgi:signal transduction histidine kinase